MPKRIDMVNSAGRFAIAVLCVAAYFLFSETVLNLTVFKGAKTDFDYYGNLVFSKEEAESADKFKRDIISLGEERQTSIPGTIVFKYKPAVRESFTLNSDGFRNEEFKKKEKDEFRIAVLGDSKVFGFAVQDKDTVSSIAQRKLREHFHKNITVLNMGVEGHDIQRAVATAGFYLEKLEPDMLVFYSWIIDIQGAFDFGNINWPPFKGDEKLIPGIEGKEEDRTVYDKVRLLNTLRHTHISDTGKLVEQMTAQELPELPIPQQKVDFAAKFPETYLGRMADATAFFDKKGVASLFILPALIHTKRPWSDNEKFFLYKNEMYSNGINLFTKKCVEGVRKALKSGKYGTNIVDQSGIFQGEQDTVFFDGIHYTPKFMRIAADHIADEIIKTLERGKYFEDN
ncbi:SGNH/GDSL hydrolase family protein [bacterium]|nr:SGNH/GDSL hydrolase family protein [bacterium]